MAISHVAIATASEANAASVTGNKPTGTAANDVLIALVTTNNQNVTPPAGWTEFFDESIDVFRCQGFYKVAGGSEPSTYAYTVTNVCPMVLTIDTWRGCDTADVFDIDVSSVASSTQSEPYSTPTLSGTGATRGRVLYFRTVREDGSTPITFSESTSGVSELADHGIFSGGSVAYSHGLFAGDSDYSTTSSKTGLAITASASETHNIAATFALKAAGSTGAMALALPSPTVSVSGNVHYDASLAVTLIQMDVSVDGFYGSTEGVVSTEMPPPIVAIAGSLEPRGALETSIRLVCNVVGETRYFGDNVILVERDKRWLIIREDSIEATDTLGIGVRESEFAVTIGIPDVEFVASTPVGSGAISAAVSALAARVSVIPNAGHAAVSCAETI